MGTAAQQPKAINDRVDCNGWLYGSYSARSGASDAERTINMYLELVQSGSGKSRATLYGTPGLAPFISTIDHTTPLVLPGGPCIGIYSTFFNDSDHVVAVSGSNLYEITEDGNYLFKFALSVGSDRIISFADNGRGTISIATGAALYMFDVTTGVTILINTVNGAPIVASSTVFIDGYFFALVAHDNKVFASDVDDPYTWVDLNYIIKDGASGQLVAIASDHLQLWVMSRLNGEIYYDAGKPPPGFPFSRIQGGFIQYGLASHVAMINMQDGLFWLGRTTGGQYVAYRNSGYSAIRISDHATESAWNDYGDVGTVYSSYYLQDGHEFFRLDFPTVDGGLGHTWVYDTATQVWHERLYWNSPMGQWEANPARFICFAWNMYIAADYRNGNIYIQSLDTLTDNGANIRRVRVGSPLARTMNWNQFHEFQLDMQMGIGVPDTGQGADPIVILEFSDDGGYTWSNEIPCSIGREGNTKARAMWRRLGKSRDRVFRVTITDPIQIAIINAYVRVSPGSGA